MSRNPEFTIGDVTNIARSYNHNWIWATSYGPTVFGLSQQNMEMKEDVRIELGNVTNNPGLITSLFEDPQIIYG